MPVVPGHELGGGMAAGQVLAGNPHAAIGLRAGGVDDLVIVAAQVGHAHVLAQFDAAEEAEARVGGGLVEGGGDRLDLLVIGRDAGADEPVGRGQPVEHVHLDHDVLTALQVLGRVEAGRPGADDDHAKRVLGGTRSAQRPCSMTIVCSVSTSPSSASRCAFMMSPMVTMPTSLPLSMTGRWRMRRSTMVEPA